MDPEIALVHLGEEEEKGLDGNPTKNFFHTDLGQKVGMIGSGILLVICLLAILHLWLKIRRREKQKQIENYGEKLAGGGMFDRNIEMATRFPYSQLSSS